MIDQGFLKSHFVGRDGFVWWIGQVAPKETWKNNFGTGDLKDQPTINSGFGERYRVRIMGYHTANKEDLPDNELPFATIMYPVTAGSGKAGASQSSNIGEGSFVFGFFLDGEEAQQPVIMGMIGYNDYQSVVDGIPSIGFQPFYGNDKKPAGGELLKPNTQSVKTVTTANEQGGGASDGGQNTTARNITSVEGHKGLKTKKIKNEASGAEIIADYIPSADSNELPIKGMQKALQKAIQQIETLKKSIRTIGEEQTERLEAIEEEINAKIEEASTAVAGAIKYIYQMIEENVFKQMDSAFKKVLQLTRPSETEITKTTTDKVIETLACFFRKLFAGLLGMVRNFIKETIDKVVNVPTCFVEKFAGNVLGTVSGFLGSAMDSIQGMVEGVVDLAGQGLDLASDVMGMVGNLLSFLNCDDVPENSPVSEWSHINGSGSQFGKGDVANILNKAKEYAGAVQQGGLDALDSFDFVNNTDFSKILDPKSQLDGCITDEFPCGPPDLNIFGSKQGAGAAGNLVINAAGSVIGVDMQSFGIGYDDQARANVLDKCGNGKGAVVRPVFGDVNKNFNDKKKRRTVNSGTPALAPDNLGFGPFDPSPYPFVESFDDSTRRDPYSPETKAFGSPSYGLGPSFSKIGKRAPKQQLSIREEDSTVDFTIETFTIPVAETEEQPVIKFVLQDKTILRNIDTDFDFSPDDQSGKGELVDGQVVVGAGTTRSFAIAPKSSIVKDGLELQFREAFEGGQRQRVVKGEKYIVRGFQYDGEPLINPLKISNDGKCVQVDDVEGAIIETVKRRVQLETPAITNVQIETTTDAGFGNSIVIEGLYSASKERKGPQIDDKKTVQVNIGQTYDVTITSPESKYGTFLRLQNDGRTIETEDHDDNDWTDLTCNLSQGRFFDLVQSGTNGLSRQVAKCKFRVDEVAQFTTVFETVKTPGTSDSDYDDLVICAKRGRFRLPKSNRLKKEGAVIYELSDDDVGPADDEPVVPSVIPAPTAPAIPGGYTFPLSGPTDGGIPGILTPGPSVNSTFHPFPGSTTLGPGKWVPGPIPPGGGGPHVGPAVFIHDGKLFGELTGQQGTPFPGTGPIGGFAPSTGGAGGSPGGIQPGGFTPGSIPPSWDPGGIGGVGGGGPGTIPPGGLGSDNDDDPGGIAPPLAPGTGPGGVGPGDVGPGGVGPGDPGGVGPGDIGPGGVGPGYGPGGVGPGDPGGVSPGGGGIPITVLPPGPGTFYPNKTPNYGPIIGIPVYPGTMVPPELGGVSGPGIGVVDIIVEDGGSGYLPGPDGSTGGDGRTYSGPNETRITYSDGVKEIPAEPGTRICLDEGDIVNLPIGTTVTTEPFDGLGGGEVIKGGAPHVMQRPGCLTTPDGGEKPASENTYPVLMYLCDVIVKKPGFGYKNTDKVIIDPDMGAEAELVVDKFGRISDVIITKPGEGFQVLPLITIESATGQKAELLAKLCIDRVRDISLVDQEKVIQVVDCVGKF
jgi:hypothetical protein